ncbi:FAD-dependent oxidoreductase [Stackebrandtia nassauensis]|uniref:Cholesterol oxidase n=1 Tax=Stackebrandtia nassauensis (strain DSM 44728 / CIP 108903 / NRRL B-16338 / NBRC 102104 / LLR-40K-21) TaxID=446470 RepID=D3PV36_STANL|nr:GMC family oxidoreductase [Stackebrandtia nassauensis]ADD41089.1 glucose-methanol-choline oxidoreductase [Stackebrandtia nassauensis DSM 44728]
MSKVRSGSATHYDVVVIGSGFGGSVAALRLTEKGYRVGVLETGARFDDPGQPDPRRRHAALPRNSWRLRKFLWAPRLGLRGIQRVHLIRGRKGSRVLVLAGAGVGGGSLVYANTLYRPGGEFFTDPQWAGIADWESELTPAYDQASRMLGVVDNPVHTPADAAMKTVAKRLGVADSFHYTRVGVHFGDGPEPVADPYFGGAGPERSGCVACGSCMTGCRQGAKNMLTENYLYLAERAGAVIHPLTTVTRLRPREEGGYRVDTVRTGPWGRGRRCFTADQVIVAAGTYGTQTLLHRMRDNGDLPGLSKRLGWLTRTNSEAILGAMRFGRKGEDHSKGLAITSSIHPDANTHIEPVRYGPGSNAMGALSTILIDKDQSHRWRALLAYALKHPADALRLPYLRHWSRRTVVALVMQNRDNSIRVSLKRGRLRAEPGHGEPNPTWIPVGHKATRYLAEEIGGLPGGTWLEMWDIPTTAHFLGGCVIGADPDSGVVDAYHRVFGQPGLHVVDGSAVSANPGVNPSLTITAQAERAMSLWPNKGEADPRPAPGQPYRRVEPVAPRQPAVPADAPGALRYLAVNSLNHA